MNILFVDDEPQNIKVLMHLAKEEGHRVEHCFNGTQVVEMEQRLSEVDVAFIDHRMHGMDGMETASYLKKTVPHVVPIMLTVDEKTETLIKAVQLGFFDYVLKSPPDMARRKFMEALRRAAALVEARRQNKRLRREKRVLERELSARDAQSTLFLHDSRLFGLRRLLKSVERYLRPYQKWMNGDLDKFQGKWEPIGKLYERQMAAALLFEGEPGSGKSTLLREISRALGSEDNRMPKDIGPTKYVGDSAVRLEAKVLEFYQQAQERRVVVIQLDDVQLPPPAQMESAGVRAEWQAYLMALRECIEDAALINRGEKPKGSILSKLDVEYQGKILWVAARNRDHEAGEIFGPLADKFTRFDVSFPRDRDERKAILTHYAEQEGFSCDEDALDKALDLTESYSGRDLIGDKDSERGFLRYALRRVQEREERRFSNDPEAEPELVITLDIVENWAQDPEHYKIMAVKQDNGAIASGIHNVERPSSVSSHFQDLDPKRLGAARKYLNEMEKAAEDVAMDRESLSAAAIGRKLDISGSAIIQRFKDYEAEMRALGKQHPKCYQHLRMLKQWPT